MMRIPSFLNDIFVSSRISLSAVISVRKGAICTVLIVNTLSGWVNPDDEDEDEGEDEDEDDEDEDEDEDETLI
jgi:hypothetical protein